MSKSFVVEKTDLQGSLPPLTTSRSGPERPCLAIQGRGLHLYPVRVGKTCLENRTVRRNLLFPYPRIVRQPAENTLPFRPAIILKTVAGVEGILAGRTVKRCFQLVADDLGYGNKDFFLTVRFSRQVLPTLTGYSEVHGPCIATRTLWSGSSKWSMEE